MTRSTGPISKRGKERSSRNAVKHGLNVATTHSTEPIFHELAAEFVQTGYSFETATEAANALLEYRRATSVYRDVYWSTFYSMPLERRPGLMSRLSRLLEGKEADVTVEEIENLGELLLLGRKKQIDHGSETGARVAAVLPLCRYQRKSVARLSKALARSI